VHCDGSQCGRLCFTNRNQRTHFKQTLISLPPHSHHLPNPNPTPAPPMQKRCESMMFDHRSADVWAVLRFALQFDLGYLQSSCLAWLREVTNGRLLWHADTVLSVAEQFVRGRGVTGGGSSGSGGGCGSNDGHDGATAAAAAAARKLPLIDSLQRDLLAEQQAAGLKQLSSYIAAAGRLQLERLREGLLRHVAARWQALSTGQGLLVSVCCQ